MKFSLSILPQNDQSVTFADSAAPATQATTQIAGEGSPDGSAAAPEAGGNSFFLMMGLMIVFMWFFVIRPENKRKKKAQEMRDSLRKGDSVVTNGGMFGKIVNISGPIVTLEVADKVRIKFDRNAVTFAPTGDEAAVAPAQPRVAAEASNSIARSRDVPNGHAVSPPARFPFF